MVKPALVLLLLTLGGCLSTYQYSYPTTPTSTYEQPSYPLGYVAQYSNLTVVIQLPFGGAMLISSYVVLSIMDSTNTNAIVSFDDSNAMHCNGGTTCSLYWNVTSSASYYLKVSAKTNLELSNLAVYYLFVSANNNAILRVTDVLRQHVIKYFNVLQEANVTLTLSPASGTTYFTLLNLDPTDSSHMRVSTTTDLTPTTTLNSVGTYTIDLVAGYYAVLVHTNTPSSVSISTQSDPYPCPYTNDFADYFTLFTGCTRASVTSTGSGLPCITYDYNSQVCLACMNGYSVSKGSCVIATSCGPREYYHFGSCYPVSSTCDQYDPYTGNCYSCANSTQYQLINGQCVLSINYCATDFHLVNSICVSNFCGTFDKSSGLCLTCITAAYVLSSGKCLPVDCGLGAYYSVKASGCVNSSTTCLNFSIIYEVCYSCISNYVLLNGVCTQYSNTNNCQIYSFAANVCTTCNDGFYVLNGGCIQNPNCSIGQVLVNGICILNPVSCNSNQVLVNGQCITMPKNCFNLNMYFQCTQCAPNFQIVAGNCLYCNGPNANFPCTTCPASQYVDSSGNCRSISPFCVAFNSGDGSCLSCTNGLTPVNGVCCDVNQVYQNGQCALQTVVQPAIISNNGGSSGSSGSSSQGSYGGYGGSVNLRSKYGPYCAKINPQTQVCTACRNGHYFDKGGSCV
jgi:hypothetical protein